MQIKLPALIDCAEGAVVDASVDRKICQIKEKKYFAISLKYLTLLWKNG